MKSRKQRYHYQVYGLMISSEIEMLELVKADQTMEIGHEIEIVYGQIPDHIEKYRQRGWGVGFLNDCVWFDIKGTAVYVVLEGKKIVVAPYEHPDMILLKMYILCSCLGFIMLQKNQVAIHGSVVEIGDGAIIISGERGAGKSTLTTAFTKKGYKFLADDVAAIHEGEFPMVCSGFPYQKLCEDVVKQMGYLQNECEYFYKDKEIKYLFSARELFEKQKRPIKAMIEIGIGDIDRVKIESVNGQEKLMHIIKNIYRGEYIEKLGGMKDEYFKQCLNIAKNISFYKVTRPKEGFTVNEQVHLIEEVLLSL